MRYPLSPINATCDGAGTSNSGNFGSVLRAKPVPGFKFTVTNDGQSPSAHE